MKTALLLAVLCSLPSMAAITSKKVGWEIDQVKYEGVLVADDAAPSARGQASGALKANRAVLGTRVLAFHGADDPFVPAEEVTAFQAARREARWHRTLTGGGLFFERCVPWGDLRGSSRAGVHSRPWLSLATTSTSFIPSSASRFVTC